MQLTRRGKSHWWLLDSDGRVIDLTLAPRETSNFPYHRGKRRPLRYTPAGISRRGRTVVERALTARKGSATVTVGFLSVFAAILVYGA